MVVEFRTKEVVVYGYELVEGEVRAGKYTLGAKEE